MSFNNIFTQTSSSITTSLNSVVMVGTNAIAVGQGSKIYYSSNSGQTWTSVSIIDGYFSSVCMVGTNAIAVGVTVWYSANSGQTWTQSTTVNNCVSVSMTGNYAIAGSFYNNGTGGNGTGIYYSTDSGATWTQSNLNQGGFIVFISATSAIACRYGFGSSGSGGGGIYYSSNNGQTWSQKITTYYYSSLFMSGNNAIVVGNYYSYYSTNAGSTWSQSISTYYLSNSCIVGNNAIACGVWNVNPGLYYSTNGGQTWLPSNQTTVVFNSVYMVGTIAVAVGNTGIYCSADSGQTWSPSNVTTVSFSSVYMVNANAIAVGSSIYNNQPYYLALSPITNSSQDLFKIFQPYTGVAGTEASTTNYCVNGTNTWNKPATLNGIINWRSITASSNGKYLAACINNGLPGRIYTSSDYGATWDATNDSPTAYWSSITSSSDGSKLAACCTILNSSPVPFQNMYLSTDYGKNWTVSSIYLDIGSSGTGYAVEQYLQSVTSDSTGTYLATCGAGGYIWRSSDSGSTWARHTGQTTDSWISITSSSNGQYLAACASINIGAGDKCSIYTSYNFGNTGSWTQIPYNSTVWSPFVASWSGSVWGWKCITTSSSGQYIAACISSEKYSTQPTYPYGIWVSNNSGATWTQTNTNPYNWFCVKFSSSGQYLIATTNGYNGIWLSRSYGAAGTWTQINTNLATTWSGIAMSSSGQYITAGAFNDSIYTYNISDIGYNFTIDLSGNFNAYTSNYITPGTNTWTQPELTSYNFTSITSSYNGQYLYACVYDGGIYSSNNYGVTWSITRAPTFIAWSSITCSANGQYLSAVFDDTNPGGVYNSTNYGSTWTNSNGGGVLRWNSVASSSSGQYVIGGTTDSGVYVSTDYGVSWTGFGYVVAKKWTGVASSTTGQYLAACASGDSNATNPSFNYNNDWIYISSDYGFNWIRQTNLQAPWKCISMSSSGQYLAAACSVTQTGLYGIWYTTNFGPFASSRTWTQSDAPAKDWTSITQSSSGQYLAATSNFDGIWTSNNYGANWTKITSTPTQIWTCIKSSSSGQYLARCGSETRSGISTYSINMDIGNIFGHIIFFTYTGSYITTSNSTYSLIIVCTGSGTFTNNYFNSSAFVNMVGGGGGGGSGAPSFPLSKGGGGGGGGAFYSGNITFTKSNSYNFTIGTGGSSGQSGSNSLIGSIASANGGNSGGNAPPSGNSGGNGGNSGNGNRGGNATGAGGGGGGGNTGVGNNSSNSGGDGGTGTTGSNLIQIPLTSNGIGGGGGGGTSGGSGTGGVGTNGGGNGGSSGIANTGGGGGGGSFTNTNYTGASGGSGVIIIAYL